jgi:hypothetical protein
MGRTPTWRCHTSPGCQTDFHLGGKLFEAEDIRKFLDFRGITAKDIQEVLDRIEQMKKA